MFTRRTMVTATPLAAAGLIGTARAQGAAPAAPVAPSAGAGQAPGFYRFKVGEIEAIAVHEGMANRPLEGLVRDVPFADVKKAMADAFLPETDFANTFTALVLRTGGQTVVIDTGFADNGAPTTGRWMANVRAAGLEPAQVNTVIISHFHADHVSGLRRRDGTAVFPNAEVMVPEIEWGFWMDDAKMAAAPDGAKPAFANARRVFGPMAKDVKRYEAGKELVPGVTAVAAPGHTPGHMAFMIASGPAKLLMFSDASAHPALFVRNPTWASVFDMDPPTARATRAKLLDMAAAERAQVSFYHAPFPATGYVAKDGSGFRFVPVQWTSAI